MSDLGVRGSWNVVATAAPRVEEQPITVTRGLTTMTCCPRATGPCWSPLLSGPSPQSAKQSVCSPSGISLKQDAKEIAKEDRGAIKHRGAVKHRGAYDLLITNRPILQPQFELNCYSKCDPSRGIGSGLSELDTSLHLRYEIARKFAPYIGVTYAGKFGETADFACAKGGIVNDVHFVFGIRAWY